MNAEPFFTRDGERFVPGSKCRGPWSATSLHARVIIGLLAHEIERRHGAPGFTPARLTTDLYRLPDLSPATVVTRTLREGGRIKVIDAEFISGGISVARATCQLLRRTANPLGETWSPPPWDAPAPDSLARPEGGNSDLGGIWETRPIVGEFGGLGPRRLWLREVRALVAGTALTPFVRAALAADFASPFANAGPGGLGWINSDATLYLSRPLAGEWIGFEVVNHRASEGVAIGECWLHDEIGPIGSATVAALAQRRNLGDEGGRGASPG